MTLNVDNAATTATPITAADTTEKAEENSYGQILKSSALIGGSQVVNIAIGIVRTKAMAVFLGPAGFGLMGLYSSIADVAQSIAGLGVNSSGVRQIAEAAGTGDTNRIARTATVLRRTSVLLGIFGALLLVVFSRQASSLTFGDNQHTAGIILLSLAVLFRTVSAGQGALIQGMRRISDLAAMGILGAFFGMIISVPLVYLFREDGVVPALVTVAFMSLVVSWWYSRKLQIESPVMTVSQVRQEATGLLKLGFAFMASGLLTMGAAYAVRIIVVRQLGLEAAGFYQAAWTLGGLYVGFILQAMGADFYPRLTAVVNDNRECNRIVNEQATVGLLLAGSGVIATLTLAPMVISVFYSARFGGAVEVLRWICLGMMLRVITWPMGYILVAKGEQNLFLFTDLAWTVVNVALSLICVSVFGLNGAGIAFLGSYVFHGLLVYLIVWRLSGFRWLPQNRKTGLFFLSLVGVVFVGFYSLPFFLSIGVGLFATLLSALYSVRVLLKIVPPNRVPQPIMQLIVWLRLA